MTSTWFVLFDEADTSPLTGESMGGCYAQLKGDRDSARREACRRYANHWAQLVAASDAAALGRQPLQDRLAAGATALDTHHADIFERAHVEYDGRR